MSGAGRAPVCVGYTAFGSGVSTEIAMVRVLGGCGAWGYTAFGSGVSTEILRGWCSNAVSASVHSLRLRGEH